MRVAAVPLILLAALVLAGCKKPAVTPSPISGGVTDRTDPLAPKTIASKDISGFYATFCPGGEWSPGRSTVFYTFEVKPDDAGVLTASEATVSVSAPADKSLLGALQAVIDAHGLAERNGEYRTTAGLPPEFWPCTLTVSYASGEKLSFTHNNEPEQEWAKDIYLAFAEWFASRGIEDLLPPETVMGTVNNVALEYHDAETDSSRDYGIWTEPDREGRRVFFRYLNGEKTERAIVDEKAFFSGVNDILSRYDMRRYDARSVLCDCEKTEEDESDPLSAALELTFWFEDGEQFSIDTSARSAIDGLMPLVRELVDYYDAFLAENEN